MRNKIKGFILDANGYYTTEENFRFPSEEKCMFCGNRLNVVYAEQYVRFKNNHMMIMGIKINGYECKECNCGFSVKNQ